MFVAVSGPTGCKECLIAWQVTWSMAESSCSEIMADMICLSCDSKKVFYASQGVESEAQIYSLECAIIIVKIKPIKQMFKREIIYSRLWYVCPLCSIWKMWLVFVWWSNTSNFGVYTADPVVGLHLET